METTSHRPKWRTLLAFATIYLVWGSTFLAIRVGVREVPPFLLAAMRFIAAGTVLYGWTILRGEPSPSKREWGAAFGLGVAIFVMDYGLVFWAEQRVASGITAVMLATIPVFTALSEITILRTRRLTVRLCLALAIGIGGVMVLLSNSLNLGGGAIDRKGALAVIVAAISWSIASVVMRKLPLPKSKATSAGAQMLAGGLLLAVTAAGLGEFRHFQFAVVSRSAWLALAYLIVFGSVIAFTAYVWLIHHESPTKVGTYAYVNPVIAVLLGYFFAGEALGVRTILGTALVLVSVLVITVAPERKVAAPSAAVEDAA